MKWTGLTGFNGLGDRSGDLPAFNPHNPVNPV
jgi:hypothetical protein